MTKGKYIITLVTGDVGNTVTVIPLTIKRIHVLGTAGTAAGAQYRLEDPNGNILYRTQASGTWYESESITQRVWPDGIKVIALDSGVIDLEYEYYGSSIY